jgi:hypothetical protein
VSLIVGTVCGLLGDSQLSTPKTPWQREIIQLFHKDLSQLNFEILQFTVEICDTLAGMKEKLFFFIPDKLSKPLDLRWRGATRMVKNARF